MNKAEILHNIRKMLEEKGIKEGRSAGMKKDSASIMIIDKDNNKFTITVTEELNK